MKKISFLIISVVFVVLGLYSFVYSERGIPIKERRFALVIGNGNYRNAPLRNPTNDANDMALVLNTLGFEVTHLENAEHRAMERAIRKFGKQLRKGGAGLFYFAGHGVQVNGRNYLIPVDAEIETESDVNFEAVDAGRVIGKMEDAGNDLNIVILDACRDNPFSRSFRTSNQGLARMDAPKGSLIAYATAPGSIAADGEGRNGLYTKHLIKHIMTPGLIVEQVLKKVRVEVLKDTGNKQIPWESSSLIGNFYFNPVKGGMKSSRIKSQQTSQITQQEGYSEKYEMLFWDSIKESNAAEPFKEYLKKFPNGVFAGLARMNIKKYSQQIEEEPTIKENAERPKLKEDSPKLAYIPKEDQAPKITLRTNSMMLTEKDITKILEKYSFFDNDRNPFGHFVNDLIVTQEGTITDRLTGLMWQKSGSTRSLSWIQANSYVKKLNEKRFADNSDWRLPTIEELASLLVNSKINNLHINSLFDRRQTNCWSADSIPKHKVDTSYLGGYTQSYFYQLDWIINFVKGHITYARWVRIHSGYGGDTKNTYNFVRAVRSLK